MDVISSIHLCSVPITPTHQLDFDSVGEQMSYFASKVKFSATDCSYTPRTGTIKVKGYVENFNDVNYGYYINSYNGQSKTFYFFIMNREMISKGTTLLTIQLDAFQTWLFDFNLEQCFIERQHATNDDPIYNRYPETFELGDYHVVGEEVVDTLATKPNYFVGITDFEDSDIGTKFGESYSGFRVRAFGNDECNLMDTTIYAMCSAGKGDAIAFIFTFPSGMCDQIGDCTGGNIIGGLPGCVRDNGYLPDRPEKFEYQGMSYLPFNKKLLQYPYNFLTVTNNNGSNVVLKYEDFDSNDRTYRIEGVFTMNPTFEFTPVNYNGKTFSYDDSISLQGFGLCSWNNDNFANWYASNSASLRANSMNSKMTYNTGMTNAQNNASTRQNNLDVQSTVGAIGGTLSALGSPTTIGKISGVIGNGVNVGTNYYTGSNSIENDLRNSENSLTTNYQNSIRSQLAQVKDSQVMPNTCKGDTSGSGLDMARLTNTFRMQQTQIHPHIARKIDYYWQMYGYAFNEVAVPNIKGRDKWNYVKTLGCVVSGNVPCTDKIAIQNMFDNGLTIWHSESVMFKYNIVNNIV